MMTENFNSILDLFKVFPTDTTLTSKQHVQDLTYLLQNTTHRLIYKD